MGMSGESLSLHGRRMGMHKFTRALTLKIAQKIARVAGLQQRMKDWRQELKEAGLLRFIAFGSILIRSCLSGCSLSQDTKKASGKGRQKWKMIQNISFHGNWFNNSWDLKFLFFILSAKLGVNWVLFNRKRYLFGRLYLVSSWDKLSFWNSEDHHVLPTTFRQEDQNLCVL